MAKITRTQRRRLVVSSIAFILTAAIMMPTPTVARGGGGGGGGGHGGGHGGMRHTGVLGSHPRHSQPRFFLALRSFPRSAFSRRHVPFGHSQTIGSPFFPFGFGTGIWPFGSGTGDMWTDNAAAPTIVVLQQPAITQESSRPAAVVRTPDAEQAGILLVRGDSKAYVTFPSGKPG